MSQPGREVIRGCPACGEFAGAGVNFCRKCGADLSTTATDHGEVVTRPIARQAITLFSEPPKPVVPLKNIAAEKLVARTHGDSGDLDLGGFADIDQPLIYTVDEKALRNEREVFRDGRYCREWCGILQPRGLLRFILESGHKLRHIELTFGTYKMIPADLHLPDDYYRQRVTLHGIESVIFKRGLRKSRILITFTCEPGYYRLNIDPIERQFVLYVSWKHMKLAKQYVSAINAELSNLKLRKILSS